MPRNVLQSEMGVSAAVYAAKKDYSILSNGTTCDATFSQNSLTICSAILLTDRQAEPNMSQNITLAMAEIIRMAKNDGHVRRCKTTT